MVKYNATCADEYQTKKSISHYASSWVISNAHIYKCARHSYCMPSIRNICIFTYTAAAKRIKANKHIYTNEDVSQWNRLNEEQQQCECVRYWIGEGCLEIISCVNQ